jgi:predicted SAM-dependent methyltransferase
MNRINYTGDDNLEVELGCGDKKHQREGFIHLDINDNGQDIVWDFTKGLPFKDNSCTTIYASHTFEHISRQDLIIVLNECWRCLKPSGYLWVIVPSYDSESRYIIPHVTQFDENTFRHLTKEMNPDYDNLDSMHSVGLKVWETIELVTNERPDIHWKSRPVK